MAEAGPLRWARFHLRKWGFMDTLTPEIYAEHVASLRRRHEVRFGGRTALNFSQYKKILEDAKFDSEANGCEPLPEDRLKLVTGPAVIEEAADDSLTLKAQIVELEDKLSTAVMEIQDLEGKFERLEFGNIGELVGQSDHWGEITGGNESPAGTKSLWYCRPDPTGPVAIVFLAESLRGAHHPTDMDAEGWVSWISEEHWDSMSTDLGICSDLRKIMTERDAGRKLIDTVMGKLGLGVPQEGKGVEWEGDIVAAIEARNAALATLEEKDAEIARLKALESVDPAQMAAKNAEIEALKDELKKAKAKQSKASKPEGAE